MTTLDRNALGNGADAPELITLHRNDVEEIAYLLAQLEDFLLHGEEHAIHDVIQFLTNHNDGRLSRWVGELAGHLRRRLSSPPVSAASHPERGPAHESTPITVEVDRGSASTRGHPPERTWLVRIRRADQSVIVAIGLSHTAADHLAAHIAHVIAPTANQP